MSARRTQARNTAPVPVDVGADPPVELAVIARHAGVRVTVVRRYIDFGLFESCTGTNESPLFEPTCASRLARAERLRRDLGLNYAGAVLACELLDRIRELEDGVRDTRD